MPLGPRSPRGSPTRPCPKPQGARDSGHPRGPQKVGREMSQRTSTISGKNNWEQPAVLRGTPLVSGAELTVLNRVEARLFLLRIRA